MADPVSKGSRAMRFPRRIVKLADPEAVVLEEFASSAVSGKAVHEALLSHAAKNPQDTIAAQWLGPLGWTPFLTVSPGSLPNLPNKANAASSPSSKEDGAKAMPPKRR